MGKQTILRILNNYFSQIFSQLNLNWTYDNQSDLEILVEAILTTATQAALEELRKENEK